jgi:membrane protease YdiL (CAAX protease family)
MSEEGRRVSLEPFRPVIIFCVIVFAGTYLIEAWLWNYGDQEIWADPTFLTGLRFVPLISALITLKLFEHGSLESCGIAKGHLKYYLYGLIYPFVVIALGLFFIRLLGTTPIDLTMTRFKEVFLVGPVYLVVGSMVLQLAIFFIPAFGEEFGWRGFLLPRAITGFNPFGGLFFTGLLWGLWHLPLISRGHYYPHYPGLIGILAFILWAILVGFFLGWLRIRSKSVFPAVLANGAINAYMGFGALFAPAFDEMITVPYGLPGILALLFMASVAFVDILQPKEREI